MIVDLLPYDPTIMIVLPPKFPPSPDLEDFVNVQKVSAFELPSANLTTMDLACTSESVTSYEITDSEQVRLLRTFLRYSS